MKIFYTLFACYCAGHIYVFFCLRRAFGGGVWQIPIALWVAAMVFPWLRHMGGRIGKTGRYIQMLSFLWMGFFIFLLYCLIVRDLAALLARFLVFAAQTEFSRGLACFLKAEHSVPAAIGAALLLFLYGLREARTPRITRLCLTTPKLAANSPPLRIAAVSDLHLGGLTGFRTLRRMTGAISAQRPDILVVAGDLVDADMSAREKEAALLRAVPAPLGKFAVTGNHEMYRGLEMSLDFMKKSGLRVLRGHTTEAGGIVIAGVDDTALAGRFTPDTTDVMRVLAMTPQDRFILLLNHKPHYPEEALGYFDLQFSGHTHGGQFWPGGFLTRKAHGVGQGLNILGSGRRSGLMFVTNGLGFWGPPVRFLAPPEVVVITLTGEKRTP